MIIYYGSLDEAEIDLELNGVPVVNYHEYIDYPAVVIFKQKPHLYYSADGETPIPLEYISPACKQRAAAA